MRLNDVPLIILVASGKGGVGKTTVASDLALTLSNLDATVGLIDADISTPNAPEVVGGEQQDISGQRLSTGDSLTPPVVNDIQLASQGVVLPDDVPVLRDGTWRAEAVADYIENCEWRDGTDAVVIDSPPGTGEELQVVASAARPDHGLIVSTPHPSSTRDARKTHEFFDQMDVEHRMVLNMAYIPSRDVVDHTLSRASLTDIDGIGEATEADIYGHLHEQAVDLPMFGHDDGDKTDVGAETVLTLPYTTDRQARLDEMNGLASTYLKSLGVEQ